MMSRQIHTCDPKSQAGCHVSLIQNRLNCSRWWTLTCRPSQQFGPIGIGRRFARIGPRAQMRFFLKKLCTTSLNFLMGSEVMWLLFCCPLVTTKILLPWEEWRRRNSRCLSLLLPVVSQEKWLEPRFETGLDLLSSMKALSLRPGIASDLLRQTTAFSFGVVLTSTVSLYFFKSRFKDLNQQQRLKCKLLKYSFITPIKWNEKYKRFDICFYFARTMVASIVGVSNDPRWCSIKLVCRCDSNSLPYMIPCVRVTNY